MAYLLLIFVSVLLFSGFLGLTIVEARTGNRVLAQPRSRLDHLVGRFAFVAQHVDWSDFIAHLVQGIGARIAHDIAHGTLIVVRFVEHQLTRVVRYLRDRRPNLLAPKPSRTPALTQTANYLRNLIRRPAARTKIQDEE